MRLLLLDIIFVIRILSNRARYIKFKIETGCTVKVGCLQNNFFNQVVPSLIVFIDIQNATVNYCYYSK
ncbi:hypothetical protein DICVIV_12159 [Dictyocaulus viviparus]|uniref:Uncharacterized protein n=1 Tax=Dictyocaulus viviparus TaxID=29172 RepID=A0A0D8XB76_DICVI|nr:hypothetical protein DICVIV_12159 [Dictyocaulus viviparus]